MNKQEFRRFVTLVWDKAEKTDVFRHAPLHIQNDVWVGFNNSFVKGDSQKSIDNMVDCLNELRQEINGFQSAIEAVVAEGEMGL